MARRTLKARSTNIVQLPVEPVEVYSVQGKRSDQPFFTSIQNYTISGKTIIARKVFDEMKVEYEDGVKTEFQKGLEKDFMNGQLSLFGGAIEVNKVQTAGTTAQDQRKSVEVSKNGSVLGLNIGGLISLAENVQERVATTDEPVVSILSDTVKGVDLSKISASKTDIATLTGTTTTDGFLNITLTTGSPSGLNSALADAGVPVSQRKTALQEASTEPTQVIEVTADLNSFEKIATSFATEVKKTIRRQNNQMGNPVGRTKPFGSVGLPKTNTLGSLLGKLLGIAQINVPGEIMPGLPKGVTIPEGEIAPPPIIAQNSDTNISKNTFNRSDISPDIKNTTPPYNPVVSNNEFRGSVTTLAASDYVFEEVGGPEELRFELVNTPRELTTMVVHWSRTPTDLDWGAKELGQLHTETQAANSSYEAVALLGVDGGLQYHYIIKRNGTIERGRPLDIIAPTLTGFGKYAVHVAFVAGFNCPHGTEEREKFLSSDSITPDQWKSFDEIVKAFDTAKNGAAEFVGYNQMPFGMLGPGFDVPEYMRNKFNKGTVYQDKDFEFAASSVSALSPDEINSRTINVAPAKPTPPNNPPTQTVIRAPVEEGNPPQSEIDARNAEWEAKSAELAREESDLELLAAEFEKAELDPNTTEARLAELEDEYYDKEYEVSALRTQKMDLKKKFFNDEYLFDEDSQKWIHGSQYKG